MPSHDSLNDHPTRRRILCMGGIGAVGGLACYLGWPQKKEKLATAAKTPVSTSPASPRLDESEPQQISQRSGGIRREDFLPHLKSAFQLDSAGTCTLIQVGAAEKMTSPTGDYLSFSLLFTAPADFITESKIHRLTHPKMEAMDLFISPVGDSKERVYLEAICSQKV